LALGEASHEGRNAIAETHVRLVTHDADAPAFSCGAKPIDDILAVGTAVVFPCIGETQAHAVVFLPDPGGEAVQQLAALAALGREPRPA
jgi:hypothetical protein